MKSFQINNTDLYFQKEINMPSKPWKFNEPIISEMNYHIRFSFSWKLQHGVDRMIALTWPAEISNYSYILYVDNFLKNKLDYHWYLVQFKLNFEIGRKLQYTFYN